MEYHRALFLAFYFSLYISPHLQNLTSHGNNWYNILMILVCVSLYEFFLIRFKSLRTMGHCFIDSKTH